MQLTGFLEIPGLKAFVGKRLDDVVENVLINRPGVVDFDFAIERRLDGATISMELVLLYEVSKVHAVAEILSPISKGGRRYFRSQAIKG